MKLFPIVVLATGLGLCQVARADEKYDKLLNEFQEAQDAWYEQLQKAEEALEDKDAPLDMSKLPPRPTEQFLERFQRYAKKHAGKPDAIPALVWIMGAGANVNPDEPQEESLAKAALDRLIEHHAAQPEVKDVLVDLRWASYSWAFHIAGKDRLVAFYEKVIEKNKNKDALAGATFNLAFTLHQASQRRDEDLDDQTRAADERRAAQLFHELARQYPHTEPGNEAEGYVFEMERLQIGMVAPDFAGRDADGKDIKLSQFRGQVVVLTFWGFW